MAIIEENYVNFTAHPEHLLTNIYQMYISNSFVDLCLVCQGSEIYAHKAIIAAASPFLRERMKEFGEYHARIHIEHEVNGLEVNIQDIKLIIEFIYKGKIHVPETRLPLFLRIGNMLQISGLYGQQPELIDHLEAELPQTTGNYNFSQPPLPQFVPSFQNFSCSLSNPNNFTSESSSSHFVNYLSPEKLSDSSIKTDKCNSTSIPVSLVSDSYPVSLSSLDTYSFYMDKNISLSTESPNIKFPSDFYVYDIQPIEITNALTTLPSNVLAPSEDVNSLIQEMHKDSSEVIETLTSPSQIVSEKDVLGNVSFQQSLYLSPGSLTPSVNFNSFLDLSFSSCKSPSSGLHPERASRLKVKDSIGGVSLQDTSQGENNAAKDFSNDTDEIAPSFENENSNSNEIHLDIGSVSEDCIELENEEEIHICPQCLKCFSTLDGLNNHQQDEHHAVMYKCSLCENNAAKDFSNDTDEIAPSLESENSNSNGIHLDIVSVSDDCIELENEEEIHICPQCLKCFSTLDGLNKHQHDEHPAVMYKCLLCSYKTSTENQLTKHGKEHLDDENHICSVCGKKFKTRETLRHHFNIHFSNKLYNCSLCSAKYSQKYNLWKHMASEHRVSPDGTPFQEKVKCSLCTFSTWAPYKLKNHQVRCHNKNNAYKCSQCTYSTNEKNSLTKHIRLHTKERPYVCDLCAQSFVTVSGLNRHIRVHSKEKPHECSDCGQKYADKKRLRDHLLKHRSLKPFQCKYCQYSCRRNDNLKTHVKRYHQSESGNADISVKENVGIEALQEQPSDPT